MKVFVSIIAAYLLGFLLTYGHAYNHRPKTDVIFGVEVQVSDGAKAFDSFWIAAFWPLYLSIKAWEKNQ